MTASGENQRRIFQRNPRPRLFEPLTIRSVTARNRIVLSPMCQYSATDGLMTDWHLVHLGARAVGGAGVVFTEAVHAEARGRITPNCLGLWNDEQRDRMKRVVEFVAAQGAVPGIQLGHAGRKASVSRPWEGTRALAVGEGGWPVIGPCDCPYNEGSPVPARMGRETIRQATESFRDAARRALEAGFRIAEIHAAHGYLIHEFLSPLSNHRQDEYGGSFENRIRFLLEVVEAVRRAWPAELPLFLRLSVTDWVPGGWTVDDSVRLCRILKERGEVDLVDCSSGGNDPRQRPEIHPGYHVPFAARIKQEAGIPTGVVGMIHGADFAESIVANGQADVVVLGRTMLDDPMWPLHAARELKAEGVKWPVQYERGNIF